MWRGARAWAKLASRDWRGAASQIAPLMAFFAFAAAGLGGGLGPTVMASSLAASAASLAGVLIGLENIHDDREGWLSAYIYAMGRGGYAAARLAATAAVATGAVAPAVLIYALLRPGAFAPFASAVLLSALLGSLMGLLLGAAAPSRGFGYAWGVSAWTGLALVYEVALTFITLYAPIPEWGFAAALFLNPLLAARLSAVGLADPYLLTLGPAGDFLYRTTGVWITGAAPLAWLAALAALFLYVVQRRDL